MLDLRLINGLVVGAGVVAPCDVGVEGGRIAELAEPGALGPARQELDATGLHVLPGAIDVHFHCRAPSHPERGGFASETAAAVAGGVTTVFEMPISMPACSTPEVLAARAALAESEAHANVALYSGALPSGDGGAEAMAEAGAIGFKLFTVAPTPGREREFEGLWTTDEGEMHASLEAIAATGLRCVVHAENESLVRHFERPDGRCRPPVVEAAAIALLAALAVDTGASLHVAHVTSALALAAVRAAISIEAPITAETCPQYLLLDDGAFDAYGGIAKIRPPLRTPADAAALWKGILDGTLSVLASDHSPFRLEEKDVEFSVAPAGLPTVELLVPLALDAVARGVLTLEHAVELLSAGPARLFGLAPRKGRIEVGADADIAVVALDGTFAPGPDTMRTRAAQCGVVYEGATLRGAVRATIVGGVTAFDGSKISAEPNGRFVPGVGMRALESV